MTKTRSFKVNFSFKIMNTLDSIMTTSLLLGVKVQFSLEVKSYRMPCGYYLSLMQGFDSKVQREVGNKQRKLQATNI